MNETWKQIEGFEKYYVSNFGRVKSCNYNKTGKEDYLKPGISRGYCHITLCKNGHHKLIAIHKLVYETFIGKNPNDMQINHINGNKKDNRLENIEICTPKENIKHAWENGLIKIEQMRKNVKKAQKRSLELNTIKIAQKRAKELGVGKRTIKIAHKYAVEKCKKKIICITNNSKYNSIIEASLITGICKTSISKACIGKQKTAGGYKWEYA